MIHAMPMRRQYRRLLAKGTRAVMSETHGTRRDGTPITDATIEQLAEEAERGYDVDEILKARSGQHSAVVSEPASVGSVRLDDGLKRDLLLRAAQERVSVFEVIRRALRDYVDAT